MTGALAKSSTIHGIIQDSADELTSSPHYLIFDTKYKALTYNAQMTHKLSTCKQNQT